MQARTRMTLVACDAVPSSQPRLRSRRRFTCAFPTTSSHRSTQPSLGGSSRTRTSGPSIVFYRSPDCIPAGFNLLDFLDFSGQPALCELHIEGRVNWASLDDPYPASQFFSGTGEVPVWFVRWPELEAAVADDVLTIGELAALPSLTVGSASFFLESIRNDTRGQRGGNEAMVAAGTAERWPVVLRPDDGEVSRRCSSLSSPDDPVQMRIASAYWNWSTMYKFVRRRA